MTVVEVLEATQLNKRETPRTSVLIVEDESIVAMDLQQSLNEVGYDAFAVAASGEEAVRAAALRCPDIALMDIRIRGSLDGIATAAIFKERFGIPVIFLTAHSDDATIARAKQTEPHAYLLKPVKIAELKSAIEVSVYKHAVERHQRERERWFGTTLKSIADAVISVDVSGRVAFMNAAAERLTGVAADKALGLKSNQVLRIERADETVEDCTPLDLALQSRRTIALARATLRRPDQTACLISDTTAPVFDDSRLLGAVMVFRDITEETRLRTQAELASRLASLGTMAAGVGHEINNPLTAIMANGVFLVAGLKALLQQLPAEERLAAFGEELSELLSVQEEVAFSAARIAKIVASLREFASDKEGPGRGDVARAARWALRMTRHETIHCAHVVNELGSLPMVALDEVKLGQIFVNLIVNAAHAISSKAGYGNRIVLRGHTGAQGRVVFEVEDTGCGIPTESLPRIFDPFFTTKGLGGGTGLGLSIAHGIVTAAGGTISASTKVGVGTVFRVALPAVLSRSESPPSSDSELVGVVTRGRVLVVDDDPAVLRGIVRSLPGHEVTSAGSGQAALELLATEPPFDLVISDVVMSGMSGVQLYKALLKEHPDDAQRMLFISGNGLTTDVNTFFASVPNTLLQKPFEPQQLARTVNQLIAAFHGSRLGGPRSLNPA